MSLVSHKTTNLLKGHSVKVRTSDECRAVPNMVIYSSEAVHPDSGWNVRKLSTNKMFPKEMQSQHRDSR